MVPAGEAGQRPEVTISRSGICPHRCGVFTGNLVINPVLGPTPASGALTCAASNSHRRLSEDESAAERGRASNAPHGLWGDGPGHPNGSYAGAIRRQRRAGTGRVAGVPTQGSARSTSRWVVRLSRALSADAGSTGPTRAPSRLARLRSPFSGCSLPQTGGLTRRPEIECLAAAPGPYRVAGAPVSSAPGCSQLEVALPRSSPHCSPALGWGRRSARASSASVVAGGAAQCR